MFNDYNAREGLWTSFTSVDNDYNTCKQGIKQNSKIAYNNSIVVMNQFNSGRYILIQNEIHVKIWVRYQEKKIKKKKNSRPTDPSNFGPVSGNPSFIFFGLMKIFLYLWSTKYLEHYARDCMNRELFLPFNIIVGLILLQWK